MYVYIYIYIYIRDVYIYIYIYTYVYIYIYIYTPSRLCLSAAESVEELCDESFETGQTMYSYNTYCYITHYNIAQSSSTS